MIELMSMMHSTSKPSRRPLDKLNSKEKGSTTGSDQYQSGSFPKTSMVRFETRTEQLQDRLHELKALEDGWLDGEGMALPSDGLDWFETRLARWGLLGVSSPRLFPTEDGHVSAEWDKAGNYITLEIDLVNRAGFLHSLHLDDDGNEVSGTLRLDQDSGWQLLTGLILGLDRLIYDTRHYTSSASTSAMVQVSREDLPIVRTEEIVRGAIILQRGLHISGGVVGSLHDCSEE